MSSRRVILLVLVSLSLIICRTVSTCNCSECVCFSRCENICSTMVSRGIDDITSEYSGGTPTQCSYLQQNSDILGNFDHREHTPVNLSAPMAFPKYEPFRGDFRCNDRDATYCNLPYCVNVTVNSPSGARFAVSTHHRSVNDLMQLNDSIAKGLIDSFLPGPTAFLRTQMGQNYWQAFTERATAYTYSDDPNLNLTSCNAAAQQTALFRNTSVALILPSFGSLSFTCTSTPIVTIPLAHVPNRLFDKDHSTDPKGYPLYVNFTADPVLTADTDSGKDRNADIGGRRGLTCHPSADNVLVTCTSRRRFPPCTMDHVSHCCLHCLVLCVLASSHGLVIYMNTEACETCEIRHLCREVSHRADKMIFWQNIGYEASFVEIIPWCPLTAACSPTLVGTVVSIHS